MWDHPDLLLAPASLGQEEEAEEEEEEMPRSHDQARPGLGSSGERGGQGTSFHEASSPAGEPLTKQVERKIATKPDCMTAEEEIGREGGGARSAGAVSKAPLRRGLMSPGKRMSGSQCR